MTKLLCWKAKCSSVVMGEVTPHKSLPSSCHPREACSGSQRLRAQRSTVMFYSLLLPSPLLTPCGYFSHTTIFPFFSNTCPPHQALCVSLYLIPPPKRPYFLTRAINQPKHSMTRRRRRNSRGSFQGVLCLVLLSHRLSAACKKGHSHLY